MRPCSTGVVLATVAMLLAPRAAEACSCLGGGALLMAQGAEAVMEVEPIELVADTDPEGGGGPIIYRVRVLRRWKGDVGEVTLLQTGSGTSCDTWLDPGRPSLVFAGRATSPEADWGIGDCSVMHGKEAEEGIEKLQRAYGIGCRVGDAPSGLAWGAVGLLVLVRVRVRGRGR